MASISKETLKKKIHDILKNADLSVLSAKKVRLQLQEKLKCDLLSRKGEIDGIVMDFVNSRAESEDNNSEEEEEEKSPVKRKAPPSKKPAKKMQLQSKDNGSGSDNDEDDARDGDYSPRKSKGRGKKKAEAGETKKAPAKGKGKGTGFTRAYKLSPELASFMGAEAMPRHEVVKKMWAVIKERNLLDPKNKQFAICDEEIHKIMGVKKFRTFGMLKYLKPHFLD